MNIMLQPQNKKLTASDLLHGIFHFMPETPYEAAKFQQIAHSHLIPWKDRADNYFTADFKTSQKGFRIENGKISPVGSKKISPELCLGFGDLSEELFPAQTPFTIEILHKNKYWLMPKNIQEAIELDRTLTALAFKTSFGVYEALISGVILDKGEAVCSSDRYYHQYCNSSPIYDMIEISALPEPLVDPRFTRLFNDLAAKDKLLAEQTELIKKQSALLDKQNDLLEKIHAAVAMQGGFGFSKG